jgi:hypothetical protein
VGTRPPAAERHVATVMRYSAFPLLVAGALGIAACSQAAAPRDSGAAVDVTRLRPEPYSLTYFSGLDEPQRTVVRDEVAWRAAWAAIWRRHSPEPPLPPVDFEREMLVIAALGSRPSTGYGILVDSAFAEGEGLLVQIRTVAPGVRCGTGGALTQPVDVARVPRTDGAVRFRDQPQVHECP